MDAVARSLGPDSGLLDLIRRFKHDAHIALTTLVAFLLSSLLEKTTFVPDALGPGDSEARLHHVHLKASSDTGSAKPKPKY